MKGLFYPGSILSLHRKAARRLVASGNGDAALLYLCLLEGRDAAALKWDSQRLEHARAALVSLQLVGEDTPVAPPPPQKLEDNTPPDYSTQDITQALQGGGSFALLVPAVEKALGKLLSPADLKSLYFIYDYLALPAEVILLLVSFCTEEAGAKHPGRKPTLPQIKREAAKWQKAGATDLDRADEYLHRRQRLSSRGMEILALLGRGDRKPVPKEETYLDAWSQMGFPDEVLTLAYERTLFHVGEFRWSYMNGILGSWQKQGLYTVQAIQAAEGQRQPKFNRPAPTPQAPGGVQNSANISTDDIDRMIQAAQWAATQGKEDAHGIQ